MNIPLLILMALAATLLLFALVPLAIMIILLIIVGIDSISTQIKKLRRKVAKHV